MKRRSSSSSASIQELAKKRSPGSAKQKAGNALAHPQNRWQRAIRYTWDKNRGRG